MEGLGRNGANPELITGSEGKDPGWGTCRGVFWMATRGEQTSAHVCSKLNGSVAEGNVLGQALRKGGGTGCSPQGLSAWRSCCPTEVETKPPQNLTPARQKVGKTFPVSIGSHNQSISVHQPQAGALYLIYYRPFEPFASFFFFIINSFPCPKGGRFEITESQKGTLK